LHFPSHLVLSVFLSYVYLSNFTCTFSYAFLVYFCGAVAIWLDVDNIGISEQVAW
jgi:hypothetical protein